MLYALQRRACACITRLWRKKTSLGTFVCVRPQCKMLLITLCLSSGITGKCVAPDSNALAPAPFPPCPFSCWAWPPVP